jgi:hypothetical protein
MCIYNHKKASHKKASQSTALDSRVIVAGFLDKTIQGTLVPDSRTPTFTAGTAAN